MLDGWHNQLRCSFLNLQQVNYENVNGMHAVGELLTRVRENQTQTERKPINKGDKRRIWLNRGGL